MRAVRCVGLSKRYRIRASIRQTFQDIVAERFGWLRARSGAIRKGHFWALKDFTLDIEEGEALGVIGDNGAGKSTLLKIVAGVTYPTLGLVEVRGRVGALIDVGAGLTPDLTGRENIYLYGTMLGLPQRETKAKFDRIVNFAEVYDFLDMPVKRYSSGMKVRLGFAVAAHLDPDILLVDEALAVGDVAFQRKCMAQLRALRDAGTTVIFVSHDLHAIQQVCPRVVWISEGRIKEDGPSHEVVPHYHTSVEREFLMVARRGVKSVGALEVERVVVTDAQGVERPEFEPGEDITVALHYRVREGHLPSQIVFRIVDGDQTTLSVAQSNGQQRELVLSGRGVVRCTFQALPLAARTYQVWAQILRLPEYGEEVPWQPMAVFAITGTRQVATSLTGAPHEWKPPLLQIPTRWEFDGTHTPSRDDSPGRPVR
ncbi:MAG: polysaccharide ABC transporter ATP-binding protein [bacterium]